MKLLQFYVDDLIKRAITEDINYIDSTTDLLIDEDDISEAYFVSKADGVLAGIDVAMRVFTLLDDTIEMNIHFKDGEKYSVVAGGGRNHRYNLTDAAMLKDNHIDAYGGITQAVTALRKKAGHMLQIEVEVRNFDELNEALAVKADVIMLDNMSCEDMKKAVEITAGRAKLEASGNVTLDNIRDVALTGVDIISLGALTHSVTAFDISMKWKKKA